MYTASLVAGLQAPGGLVVCVVACRAHAFSCGLMGVGLATPIGGWGVRLAWLGACGGAYA